jgi:flagellar protein FlbD
VITLTRLNGSLVAINPDLITWIEVTPDTTVSLLGGDKLIVRERLDEVVQKVIAFRHAVANADPTASQAYPPSSEVLQGVAWKREQSGTEDGSSSRSSAGRFSSRPGGQSNPPVVYKK